MPVTIRELYLSRDNSLTTTGATKTVRFAVIDATDENEAQFALLVYTPLYAFGVGGLPHRRAKIALTRKGPNLWLAEVEYEWTQQAETATEDAEDHDPIGIEFGVDSTGGSVHITQSIKTRFARAAGDAAGTETAALAGDPVLGKAPDNKQAIGLTYDRVEGCDIPAPGMEITASLNYIGLTFGQARSWGRLKGKTNKARWKGFDIGELMYLGSTIQIQPGQLAKATHKFSFGEHIEAGDPRLIIKPAPNGITLPRKRAHDYLWVGYRPFLEQPAGGIPAILQRPTSAYMEQVAFDGDFTVLGLGS